MTRSIAFVNLKGGVGKTSLVVNLAACLAHDLGQRTLVVDCDAQCNASMWLAGRGTFSSALQSNPDRSLYGMVTGNARFVRDVVWASPTMRNGTAVLPQLDLIPASPDLMEIEDEFQPRGGIDALYGGYYEGMRSLWPSYDYILFDCPPNFYRSTRCAVFASREIYIPCLPDALSNMGLAPLNRKLSAFLEQTEKVRGKLGDPYTFARVRGAIINRIPMNADVDLPIDEISLKLKSERTQYPDVYDPQADVLDVRIRQSIEATRLVDRGLPAILTAPHSALTQDYLQLAYLIHGTGDKYRCA